MQKVNKVRSRHQHAHSTCGGPPQVVQHFTQEYKSGFTIYLVIYTRLLQFICCIRSYPFSLVYYFCLHLFILFLFACLLFLFAFVTIISIYIYILVTLVSLVRVFVCVFALSPTLSLLDRKRWASTHRSHPQPTPSHVVCLALQCLHRLQCLCVRSISPFFRVPPAFFLGPHDRHTVVYLPLCCFYLCKYRTTWSQLLLFLYLTTNKMYIYSRLSPTCVEPVLPKFGLITTTTLGGVSNPALNPNQVKPKRTKT